MKWVAHVGKYTSPVQSVALYLDNGCSETKITIEKVDTIKAVIGQRTSTIIKVSNSAASRLKMPSLCGSYASNGFGLQRRQLKSAKFANLTSIEPNEIELALAFEDADSIGLVTLTLEVALAEFP